MEMPNAVRDWPGSGRDRQASMAANRIQVPPALVATPFGIGTASFPNSRAQAIEAPSRAHPNPLAEITEHTTLNALNAAALDLQPSLKLPSKRARTVVVAAGAVTGRLSTKCPACRDCASASSTPPTVRSRAVVSPPTALSLIERQLRLCVRQRRIDAVPHSQSRLRQNRQGCGSPAVQESI